MKQLINDEYSKKEIGGLFKSPISLVNASADDYACSLFDEAHRMYEWRGGIGVPKNVNIIERAVNASKVSVFFIDSDQAVTVNDSATIESINAISDRCRSKVYKLPRLETQFRVLGGNEYLDMVKKFLGFPDAPNDYPIIDNYDFRVFDSPTAMRDELRKLNDFYGKTRMVAGYDYEWYSEKDPDSYDIILENGEFKAKWNLKTGKTADYSWLYDEESFEEVGCIHTCQGLDMEYCGVIIGPDMRYENGTIIFDQTKLAKTDKSSGIRKCAPPLAEKLIRNTYNVLMTRGMRGTFVYCEDKALHDYLNDLYAKCSKTNK